MAEAVPPRLYGGTERVVHWLTEELVRQGHDVTLFASGDSTTAARLIAGCPTSLREAGVDNQIAYVLVMLDKVHEYADRFDVIHCHVDVLQMRIFKDLAFKTVSTLHGRLDLPDVFPIYQAFPWLPLVSISDSQRAPMPPVNWAATIHHGMPRSLISFSPDAGRYLAFLGRITPEKRPDRAIDIAKRAGVPLKIAAKVDRVDEGYFRDVIAPMLDDPLIEFLGEIGDSEKGEFLGGARALLFPIDWPEPFGLAMIEAMAAGTPVIAWPNGAAPEVVDEGSTGFLVESIDQAVEAVKRVGEIDRRGVRATFERRFTVERMTADYLSVYRRLLEAAEEAPVLATPER